MTATEIHRKACISCRRGDTWPAGLASHYRIVTTKVERERAEARRRAIIEAAAPALVRSA